MRRIYLLLFTACVFAGAANAQLSGTKNIPGDYATLAAAITDLNTQGVGAGGVIINLVAANPQTAPAGGYVVGGTGSLVLTTSSSTNPVTIQGNGNTITASAALTVGALNDAIFKLIGADWVTITGFVMTENAANTTTTAASNNMTEWGVALLYVTATDGSQNNTIQTNTIDLDRTYQNTFGIYANATHTATAVTASASATGAAGGNSGLKIYGNTITDVNNGIVVVGPTAAADNNDGVEIGGTAPNANSITNFGTTGTFSGYANVSGTVNGILVRNSKNFSVSFNTVTSSNGGTTAGTLNGIQVPAFSNAPTGTFTNNVNSNIVSVRSGNASGAINGINILGTSASATSTINVNGNDFNTCGHTVAGSGSITFLSQSGTHLNTTISNNTFTNLTVNTTGSVTFISNNATRPANAVSTANNNSIVTAFNKTGVGGAVTFYVSNSSTPTSGTETTNGNNFSNVTLAGVTSASILWQSTDGSTSSPFGPAKIANNNTFSNIACGASTASVIVLNVAYSNSGLTTNNVSGNTISNVTSGNAITGFSSQTASQNIFNNTISGLSSTGAVTVTGLAITGGATQNIYKNKIYDLQTNNAAGVTLGMSLSGGTTNMINNVYNNLVGDLRAIATSSTSDAIRGISVTSSATTANINVFYNSIYINATTSGANFNTSGIFHTTSTTATTSALTLRNNIIVNSSTAAGTGTTVAYRRSSGAANNLANYGGTSNNNLFYAGAPSATNLIYSDGTSSAQSLSVYKSGVFTAGTIAPRDANSATENPPFLSTTGSSSNFLHINPATPTQVESGGANIATFTDDFDGDTRNATTPDIGADEGTFTAAPNMSYVSSTTTQTNTSTVPTNSTNQQVIGIQIVTTGPLNPLSATSFTLNTNGTTNVANIANAKLWYTGTSSTFATTTQFGSTVAAPSGSYNITGTQVLADGTNYFWLTYDVPCGATISNVIDGECNSVTVGVAQTPTVQAPAGSRSIVSGPLSGTYTVGSGGTYATLTAAIADINLKGLGGNTLFNIISSITEPGAVTINPWAECGGTGFTLTIKPTTTATISASSASAVIIINAADRVIIDGSIGSVVNSVCPVVTASRDLTIANTNTGTSSAVIWLQSNGADGATNNIIKNCNITGNATTTTLAGIGSGSSTISTSSLGTGNNTNTFENNNIKAVQVGIYSQGASAANKNTGNIINQNVMNAPVSGANQNIRLAGIFVGFETNITMSGNTIGSIAGSSGDGFGIAGGSLGISTSTFTGNEVVNATITNNRIDSVRASSTFSVSSIYIVTSTNTGTNLIADNVITNAGINGTSGDFGSGIFVGGGAVTTNIYFNSVSMSGTFTGGAYPNFALAVGGSNPIVNIKNNVLSAKAVNAGGTGLGVGEYAIGYAYSTFTNLVSNNNDYFTSGTEAKFAKTGGLAAAGGTDIATLAALQTATTQDAASISADPLFNSLSNLQPQTTSPLIGAGATGTGVTNDITCVTRSVSTPTIGAYETGTDVTVPVITYTTLGNTLCGTDRTLSATITDASGVNTTAGTKPRLYFKKSTDANTFAGNTSGNNGWKFVEASNASSPFSFTTNYALLQAAVAPGDIIQYFVVAQDLAAIPNVAINSGVFAVTPTSVALTSAAFPLTGTINSYTITAGGLTTDVTIGAAGTYTSLTGAGGLFAAINAGGLANNITATILDATVAETGANALNAINYGCAGTYTLTIKPNTGVTTVLSGSAATALIDLNGADNVTFDGSNNGSSSKNMTIRNTGAGATFRLINDATTNTIKNTIVEGQNTSTTSGTIFFSTAASGTLGNSNNTINNCDVRDRSDVTGVSANAIFSSGSAGAPNATNTVSGSNIFNWTRQGVLVAATGTGNTWVVSSNNFYQTAARSAAMIAISIQAGSGHSILTNNIGGTAINAGGSNLITSSTFHGINLTVGTASATSVQGNTIKNIRSTFIDYDASYGIFLQAGMANIGNITGNTVGSSNAAERFEVNGDSYGIRVASTSSVNLSNNTVNNFTTSSTVPVGEFYWGISVEGTGGTHSVINNTVANLTNGSTEDLGFGFSSQTIGILVQATGVQTVRGNTVHDIASTSTATITSLNNKVFGMAISGTAAGTVVEKNNIYNVYASSPTTGARADLVSLLIAQSGANATFSNNTIANGSVNPSSDRITSGIVDFSTTPTVVNYYFNSISITGTATGVNGSYAFNRNGTATVDIRNNIFSNTRTGGTGFNVAIANTNAAATGWSASSSNYNDVYSATASTVGQWLGTLAANNRDFSGWKASQGAGTPGSGGDANSFSIVAPFTSAIDLHIPVATPGPLESGGTAAGGITTDIDGQTRPGPAGSVNGGASAPDIGADEFDGIPAAQMVYVSSTTTQSNTTTVGTNAVNQEVIGVRIVTTGSFNPLSATSFTLNTNGTTATTDISNARLWYTGTSSTFATGTQFGSVVATPSGSFIITGTQALQEGTNYFWLTYDISCTATASNVIDGECNSLTVGSAFTPTVQAPAGSRSIIAGTLAGTKTVGTGGDYATLTDAAAAINSFGLSNDATLSILNSITEAGAVVINQWPECGAGGYTLTIKPAASTNPLISANSSTAVIKLNGADRVIIDGSNNGTSSRNLTFTNTSTSASAVVIWLASPSASDGATNNVIKNCIITGDAATTTGGGIITGGTTIGSAALTINNKTTITNNFISKVQIGITLTGVSATTLETSNFISLNTLGSAAAGDGFSLVGIQAQFQDGLTISGNDVQNITNSTTSGDSHQGIGIFNCTNSLVDANKVHFMRYTGSSSNKLYGIMTIATSFNTIGSPSNNQVSNNAVYDMTSSSTSSFWGVLGITDNGGYSDKFYYNSVSITGNVAGGSSAAGSCFVNDDDFSGGSACTPIDVRNNIFSMKGSSAFAAPLYTHFTAATSSAGFTLNYNDLYVAVTGSAVGNIGRFNSTDYANLAAWQGATTEGANSISSDANFNTNTDLQPLSGSPVIGAGTFIGAVTTDITGFTRSVTTPSIGAYEQALVLACGNINNLAFSSVTNNSVQLNWDAVGGATYQYAVTTSLTPPGSGTAIGTNSVNVGSLTGGTVYYAHVRANCGGGNFGNWTTVGPFTTLCDAITSYPFTETFETSSPTRICWKTDDFVAGTLSWTYGAGSPGGGTTTTAHGGTSNARFFEGAYEPDNVTRLVSPKFDLSSLTGSGAQVRFWFVNEDWSGDQDELRVYYKTSIGGTWTLIPGAVYTTDQATWTEVTLQLPSISSDYYIGFEASEFYGRGVGIDDVVIEAAPTCFAPTALTALSTSATTATVSWTAASPAPSSGYEWKMVLAGAGSGGAAVASGTTGAGVVTDNATGLATNVNYDLFVRSNCGGGGFSTYAGPKTFFLQDDAAGAITLTVGAACTGATYSDVAASKSTNEVYPSCSGTAVAPVWFKFVAPASGAVRISTDAGTGNTLTDTKVGLFSATNATDYSTFNIISCDEDGGSALGLGYMSVVYATGLTGGTTYYIAVDKFSNSTTSGTFCITVEELSNTMLASSANTCATSIESPLGDADYTGWIPLVDDADSKLIALIKNPLGGIVEDYNVSMNVNTSGTVRTDLTSTQRYLDRNFHLDSAGVSAVNSMQVQLFFTTGELSALQAVDPAVTLANLGVTRQAGTICQDNFDVVNGSGTFIPQTGSGSVNGAAWVTFTTNGFSNFYLHTSKAPVTLKTFLQGDYNGTTFRHNDVTSQWVTVLNAGVYPAGALTQPYSSFGHAGTESVSPGFFTATGGTTDIVDWVLLELRSAAPPAAPIATRAAFIREDGAIVDLDKISSVSFRGVPNGTYYVTIRHRNHLGIRTATMQVLDGALGSNSAPTLYDFTTALTKAFKDVTVLTNEAMVLSGSTYLMWGGNVNQDLFVRATSSAIPPIPSDASAILSALGGNPNTTGTTYSSADINMDGRVRATSLAIPPIPSDASALLTILGGNNNATRKEHK